MYYMLICEERRSVLRLGKKYSTPRVGGGLEASFSGVRRESGSEPALPAPAEVRRAIELFVIAAEGGTIRLVDDEEFYELVPDDDWTAFRFPEDFPADVGTG